jgi:hypothetical protein
MITLILAAWAGGFIGGLVVGSGTTVRRDRDRDWRRSFNHENINRPSGAPPLRFRRSKPDARFIRMDEGRIQRGNAGNDPTTPKPKIMPRGQWPSEP